MSQNKLLESVRKGATDCCKTWSGLKSLRTVTCLFVHTGSLSLLKRNTIKSFFNHIYWSVTHRHPYPALIFTFCGFRCYLHNSGLPLWQINWIDIRWYQGGTVSIWLQHYIIGAYRLPCLLLYLAQWEFNKSIRTYTPSNNLKDEWVIGINH